MTAARDLIVDALRESFPGSYADGWRNLMSDRILAALAEAGLKPLAREPMEEQIQSVTWVSSGWVRGSRHAADTWRAMWDAAP